MAFEDLSSRDALAVLAKAPTPEQGAALGVTQIEAVLGAAGRQRNLRPTAEAISAALRTEQLTALPLVARAVGATVAAHVAGTIELVRQTGALEQQLTAAFEQHPSAKILRDLPGLGVVSGARVLAEFGDDPHRYADAKARKNYAGTALITRALGKSRVVLARYARNPRLADALYLWSFSALNGSAGARVECVSQRGRGVTHDAALRALANRLVGILHGCLRHVAHYPGDAARPRRAVTADQEPQLAA